MDTRIGNFYTFTPLHLYDGVYTFTPLRINLHLYERVYTCTPQHIYNNINNNIGCFFPVFREVEI